MTDKPSTPLGVVKAAVHGADLHIGASKSGLVVGRREPYDGKAEAELVRTRDASDIEVTISLADLAATIESIQRESNEELS